MDKNTLSNYGWIVIAVLVLSVMIALATPFGEYIKDAVWSTTEGLFNVQNNALDIIGATTNSNPNQSSVNFSKKDIYDDSMYVLGLQAQNAPVRAVMMDTATTGVRSIVLPLELGKCYEIKFPNESQRLVAFVVNSDPRELEIGEEIPSQTILKEVWSTPTETDRSPLFMLPQTTGQYLVIYTGWSSNVPVSIIEHTIVAETDTQGPWYTSPVVADINGNVDSFGDFNWDSEEFVNNVYEPMRLNNPDYITRTNIGKDQSGLYDMYSYVFEPENYEQTMFLTAGQHGDEEGAYFALGNFMQQICYEDGSNEQLHYLRTKVRFVVIPIVNVWSVSQRHIRYNSTSTDLNRDWGNLTQQETKNVYAEIERYSSEITMLFDFHTTPYPADSDLYYNFPIVADNADCNLKTVNHIYHTLLKKGYVNGLREIYTPTQGGQAAVTGKYPTDTTLQGTIWNRFNIPTITIEHLNNDLFPEKYSSDAMTLAIDAFGNFIIQNALYFKP